MEPGTDHTHEPPPQSRRSFVSVSRALVTQLFGAGKEAFVDFHGTMPAAMTCVIHVDPWGVRFDFERVSTLRTSADDDVGHVVLHRACLRTNRRFLTTIGRRTPNEENGGANRKVIIFAWVIARHANTVAQRRYCPEFCSPESAPAVESWIIEPRSAEPTFASTTRGFGHAVNGPRCRPSFVGPGKQG